MRLPPIGLVGSSTCQTARSLCEGRGVVNRLLSRIPLAGAANTRFARYFTVYGEGNAGWRAKRTLWRKVFSLSFSPRGTQTGKKAGLHDSAARRVSAMDGASARGPKGRKRGQVRAPLGAEFPPLPNPSPARGEGLHREWHECTCSEGSEEGHVRDAARYRRPSPQPLSRKERGAMADSCGRKRGLRWLTGIGLRRRIVGQFVHLHHSYDCCPCPARQRLPGGDACPQ